jgi:hypothetical protein
MLAIWTQSTNQSVSPALPIGMAAQQHLILVTAALKRHLLTTCIRHIHDTNGNRMAPYSVCNC